MPYLFWLALSFFLGGLEAYAVGRWMRKKRLEVDTQAVERATRETVAGDIEKYRDDMLALVEKYGGDAYSRAFINEVYDGVAMLARGTQWVGSDKEKHVA